MKTQKKLTYYEATMRQNGYKLFFMDLFLSMSEWLRIFIETFTRRSQGERYFQFSLNLTLIVLFAIYPLSGIFFGATLKTILLKSIAWYAYLFLLLKFSLKRRREVAREPNVWDFEKYSKFPGRIESWVYKISDSFGRFTPRQMAIYVEPAIALAVGIVLLLLRQNLGYLLIVSAVFYHLGWSAQFYKGDQFIMDKIDEMICNEQLVESFVHNRPPNETKGFEVYGKRPKDPNFRRRVAEELMDDEPGAEVA